MIDRGDHSLERQTDRQIYGTREVHGATRKQRDRIDRIVFLARRIAHYHAQGMLRTREGVEAWRDKLSKDDLQYQARTRYGTDRPNTSQFLKPLPAASTLLRYEKLLRMAEGDPRVFQPSRSRSDLLEPQQADWRAARRQQRAEAGEKRAARAGERAEARDTLRETGALIALSAGVGPRRYSLEEVDRMARHVRDFGKGQHEKPFIGGDEYRDPLMYGFATGADEEDADPDADDLQDPGIDAGQSEGGAAADDPGVVGTETVEAATAADEAEAPRAPGGLDRFRSKVQPRSGGSAWQEDHG